MFLINSIPHACLRCIKGHRTKTCQHTTSNELRQLKPRGRPRSQCEICRRRRLEGGRHQKCGCAEKGGAKEQSDAARLSHLAESVDEGVVSGKRRRKRGRLEEQASFSERPGSTSPKEVQASASCCSASTSTAGQASASRTATLPVSAPAAPRTIASLLNPCACLTGGICKCCARSRGTTTTSADSPCSPRRQQRTLFSATFGNVDAPPASCCASKSGKRPVSNEEVVDGDCDGNCACSTSGCGQHGLASTRKGDLATQWSPASEGNTKITTPSPSVEHQSHQHHFGRARSYDAKTAVAPSLAPGENAATRHRTASPAEPAVSTWSAVAAPGAEDHCLAAGGTTACSCGPRCQCVGCLKSHTESAKAFHSEARPEGSSVNTHSHSSSLSPDSSTSTSSSSKSVRTPSERSPDAALGGAPSSSAAQQDDARAAQKQDDCKRCETCHGCIHGLLAPRTGIEVVDLWMSAASANNRGLAG